jgi:hypothetical protein
VVVVMDDSRDRDTAGALTHPALEKCNKWAPGGTTTTLPGGTRAGLKLLQL